jgi:hypothetical protein
LKTGLHYLDSSRNGSYFMVNFCDRLSSNECEGKTPYICESRTITNNLGEKFEFIIDSGDFYEFQDAPPGGMHKSHTRTFGSTCAISTDGSAVLVCSIAQL